jgi:hypothetical protein
MKMKIVSGAGLAAAAIALAMSGGAVSTAQAKHAKMAVHCMGVNSCKGKSMCKSAHNACKGQNSCKGMGWLPEKSKAACVKAGGTVG